MMKKIFEVNRKKQIGIICVLLAAATLAVYLQVAHFDFLNLDDNVYVTDNAYIHNGITPESIGWAFTTVHAEFWHPLTWLSLMLDHQVHELNAGGYHLTNVFLHVISTLLLFGLFLRMTGAIWRSAFVAALFALHPLHVESVAWIAERKDVLSAFFWMLTLVLYVRYTDKPGIWRYLLVLLSFACGLMSKSMVVTLPVVMILLDYWPLKRLEEQKPAVISPDTAGGDGGQKKKKRKAGKDMPKIGLPAKPAGKTSPAKILGFIPIWQIREKLPLFALSAIFAAVTFYAQYRPAGRTHPWSSLIANALVSYAAYIGKTFLPLNLAVFYPFSDKIPLWQVMGSALFLLAVTALVIMWVRRIPCLFVGWFWYIVTLVPVIGIFNHVGNQAMADRYSYLTTIGISIMLAWGVPLLIRKKNLRAEILIPVGAITVLLLSAVAWQQCSCWKNNFTLYDRALKVTRENDLAHYNLGNALKDQGKLEEALGHFREAVRIRPASPDAHNNIGIILELHYRQYDEAIDHYRQALNYSPRSAGIHFNYGMALYNKGDAAGAIEHFRQAMDLAPHYESARRALKMAQEAVLLKKY